MRPLKTTVGLLFTVSGLVMGVPRLVLYMCDADVQLTMVFFEHVRDLYRFPLAFWRVANECTFFKPPGSFKTTVRLLYFFLPCIAKVGDLEKV